MNKEEKEKKEKELREKSKKENKVSAKDLSKQLATREILERDYKEDIIYVKFKSSTQTERYVEALKPSNKQMSQIMTLFAKAQKFQESQDADSIEELNKVYLDMAKLVGALTTDKNLDSKFWNEYTSNSTLNDFVMNLVTTAQGVTKEELDSFRK